MKRFSVLLVFAMVIILAVGVIAETNSISPTEGNSTIIQSTAVSGDTAQFVKNVASNRGIPESEITGVRQVDFNNLPSAVNITNIDNTTLALYQVSVNGSNPVYVITASQTAFKKELQNFVGKMLLNLGLSGEITNSSFLMSAAGVQGSYDKGYVMIRDGSITGISTNLENENQLSGQIAQIVIYKNGEPVGFRNTFDLGTAGSMSDYNTVGDGTVNFNKGDIISVRVILPNGASVRDINTLLEISEKE